MNSSHAHSPDRSPDQPNSQRPAPTLYNEMSLTTEGITVLEAGLLGFGRKSAVGRWLAAILALALLALPAPSMRAQQAPMPATALSVPASRKAKNVAVITIRDQITSVTADSVRRRITLAEKAGADAIVFEIDTPGGDLYAALAICKLIKNCSITNTVAWVNTKAYSAGAIIALACKEIVNTTSSDFGDALPIAVDPLGQLKTLGKAERQKITAPMIAEVVDSARRNGYDEYLVQGLVSLGVELWLIENIQTKQRLCINRAEYRRLFDGEPPTDRPRVASTPAESPTGIPKSPASPSPSTLPSAASDLSSEKTSSTDQPGQAANQAVGQTEDATNRDFSHSVNPASPTIADTMSIASSPVLYDLAPTTRITFTPADKGRWRLVEFVTSGTGPLMLKSGDMKELGLASDTVNTDEELARFFGATNVRRLDQSWSEGLVIFLTNIIVRGVLIVIFLCALFIEMTHPGVIVPGAVAAVALFGLLAPPVLIGLAGWWEIAAVAGGILLILLELFVIPGFGVAGVVGILALFAGLLGTFIPNGAGGLFPNTPQARTELVNGFTTLILSAATAGLGMYFLAKNFGSLPILNRLVLKDPEGSVTSGGMLSAINPSGSLLKPGTVGLAVTPLRPSGRVMFGEQVFDVVAELAWIPVGSTVRVSSANEFRVAVELVTAAPELPTTNFDEPSPEANT